MRAITRTLRGFACTYCGAKPGKRCVSKSGGYASSHSARYYAAHDAKALPWQQEQYAREQGPRP